MKNMEKIRCHLIFYLNIRKSHLGINSQCHLYKMILIWHNIILSVNTPACSLDYERKTATLQP